MELSLSHTLHLFNIFREYDGKDNCAQVLEEEIYKMFGTKYLNDEHDCNVVSMNSLNIHDANDMQSHKLGDAMFDEDDIFCPPSFDEQIYFDDSMPPIYDDYIDESGFGRVSTLESSDPTILEDVESYCDGHESWVAIGLVGSLLRAIAHEIDPTLDPFLSEKKDPLSQNDARAIYRLKRSKWGPPICRWLRQTVDASQREKANLGKPIYGRAP